jgi:hypothetical protein
MLSLVVVVCAAIFLVKGFIAVRDLANPVLPPVVYDGRVPASLGRVWACCAEDFAVGLGCLLAGWLALRLAPSAGTRRALRLGAHLAAAAALAFVVVNAELFHVLRQYLTLSLVQLSGGLRMERSVAAYATTPVKLAVALVPTLALAAHLAGLRAFPRAWRWLAHHGSRPALLLLVPGLALVGHAARRGLAGEGGGDYPCNPHLHFARSLFRTADVAGEPPPDAEAHDFLPGRPGHTPGLLPRRPTNVIFIVVESARASAFEAYGSPFPTTPNLRGLEDRGVVFENFYATANHTIASALPLYGGLYNDPTTVSTLMEHPEFPVPGAAEWLQRFGYRTYFLASGGKTAWEDYRNLVPAFCVKGFDVPRDPAAPFWRDAADPRAMFHNGYLDEALFADVKRAVRAERGNKFALFVWCYESHAPFFEGSSPDWDGQHFPPGMLGSRREDDFRCYLGALWRLDALIGDLYRELEDLGLADETLIVLTGDHGEAWGEHGLLGHGSSVYEEQVRVPLLMIGPRLAPLGRRNRAVGSHVDLWATITDVCGLPADPRWQGRSLVSGPEEGRRAYFYTHLSCFGVREGRHKYIWDSKNERHLLFDLESDPLERENLAGEAPGVCELQHQRIRDWAAFQSQLIGKRLNGGR